MTNDPTISNFIANIATDLAVRVAASGSRRVKETLQGDAASQALERSIYEGVRSVLTYAVHVEPEELVLLENIFEDFFRDDEAARQVALLLRGNPLDVEELSYIFQNIGYDIATLPGLDFAEAMRVFERAFLSATAGEPALLGIFQSGRLLEANRLGYQQVERLEQMTWEPELDAGIEYLGGVSKSVVVKVPVVIDRPSVQERSKQVENKENHARTNAQIFEVAGAMEDWGSLARYKERYQEYLLKEDEYVDFYKQILALQISLENIGSIPANDIIFLVMLPPNVHVYKEQELPRQPRPPQKPALRAVNAFDPHLFEAPHVNPLRLTDLSTEVDVVIQSVRKNRDGVTVEFRLPRLQHHLPVTTQPIYVDLRNVRTEVEYTLTLGYQIHASNLSTPVSGNFNITVSDAPVEWERWSRGEEQ